MIEFGEVFSFFWAHNYMHKSYVSIEFVIISSIGDGKMKLKEDLSNRSQT